MRSKRSLRSTWMAALLACGCTEDALDRDDSVGEVDQALAAYNGIIVANGLNFPNGFTLANGISLTNGLNFTNGIQFTNGIALTNGINFTNGATAPDGVVSPYVFPSYCASSTRLCVGSSCITVSGCTDSDLTKWIDSNPTNN